MSFTKYKTKSLYLLCFIFIHGCSNSPWQKISDNISEMKELSQLLSDREQEVDNLLHDYQYEKSSYISKIKQLVVDEKTALLADAKRNTHISRYLDLLRQREAYIKFLSDYRHNLKTAAYEISFLIEKAEAQMKMERLLEKQEISEMSTRISSVVKKYSFYKNNLSIKKIDNRYIPSLEEIWEMTK